MNLIIDLIGLSVIILTISSIIDRLPEKTYRRWFGRIDRG